MDSGLSRAGSDYVIYSDRIDRQINVTLPRDSGRYHVHWLDVRTGELQSGEAVVADRPLRLRAKTNVLWLERDHAE
jgi:hypothetical protein